jgi:RNA polymerase sigma-70 factor (ECF subfamily)
MSRRERITDEWLVLRCQEGDAAAFERLVVRWQERLWRHAWRLLGNEEAAWDALQETWIAISRDLVRLRDPAAFRTWAYQIGSNKCRDWIRRERRRRRADEAYSGQVREAEQESCDAEGAQASLKEALARLPGRDRAILALRYQERFDTAQIAEILRIPAGTVKSRLYHARQRLRTFLEETDDE